MRNQHFAVFACRNLVVVKQVVKHKHHVEHNDGNKSYIETLILDWKFLPRNFQSFQSPFMNIVRCFLYVNAQLFVLKCSCQHLQSKIAICFCFFCRVWREIGILLKCDCLVLAEPRLNTLHLPLPKLVIHVAKNLCQQAISVSVVLIYKSD